MRRVRLSYANIVSTLALVVAVGGGTAIAVGGNASSVDGVSAEKISFARNGGDDPNNFRTIANIGGLKLQAACWAEAHNHLYMRARTSANNTEILVTNLGSGQQYYDADGDFDQGDTLTLPEDVYDEFVLTYVKPNGGAITATYFTFVHGTTPSEGQKDCHVGGTALFAP